MSESSCQYCNLHFNKKNSLVKHQELCNKRRVDNIECKICYKIFHDTLSLKNHVIECSKNTVNFNSDLFESLIHKIDTYKALYNEQRMINLKLEKDLQDLTRAYQQNLNNMNSFLGIDTVDLQDISQEDVDLELFNKNSNNLVLKHQVIENTTFTDDDHHRKEIEKYRANFDYNQIINDIYKFIDNSRNDIRIYKDLEVTEIDYCFINNNKNTIIKLFSNYCDFLQKRIDKYEKDECYNSYSKQKQQLEHTIDILYNKTDFDIDDFKMIKKNLRAAIAEIVLR